MMSSVCAVVSNRPRQSGPSSLSLITSLSVLVLFLHVVTLAVHSFTDSLFTGVNSPESALGFFIHERMSEHVVERGGEVGLQLFMSVFSV